MKSCSKCKVIKPFTDFYKSSSSKTGLQANCKSCKAKENLARYHDKLSGDVELIFRKRVYDASRRQEKSTELRAFDRERSKTPKRIASKRDWSRKRKLIVKQQTPAWADQKSIKQIYESCVIMSKKFNVDFEVDHIIPLRGKNVCGLHVESNLQLLEKSLNLSKRNKPHWELDRRVYPAK